MLMHQHQNTSKSASVAANKKPAQSVKYIKCCINLSWLVTSGWLSSAPLSGCLVILP